MTIPVSRKGVAHKSILVYYDAGPNGEADTATTKILDELGEKMIQLAMEYGESKVDVDGDWAYEPNDDDGEPEPEQCNRCGARYREDPSCGKTIHLDLPSRS